MPATRPRAWRRLADEYDAAQDRGEVKGHGNKSDIPKQNITPTVTDIGLSSKEIHEARIIRDARSQLDLLGGRLGIERSAGARRRVTATKIKWWNLIPAASAVPAAPAKQQNDKYDDEKRGGIHVRNSSWECVCTATTTNPFDPYPFL